MTDQIHELRVPGDDGRVIPFRLKRNRRNRYLRVSVRDTGEVILSVPRNVSDSGAMEFLKSQAEWLVQTLGKVPVTPSIQEHLKEQPWISLDGCRAKVELDRSKLRTHWVADPKRGETVIRTIMSDNTDAEIMSALMEMARHYVPERVHKLAAKVGVKVRKVQIRNQRSRWGSCSSLGNLSFNWRIILLPPHLHDHIIFHELAHLSHLDHSSRFYRLLEEYDPKAISNDHSISKLSSVMMAMCR